MTEARDLADRFHERWLHANPFAATMDGIPGSDDLDDPTGFAYKVQGDDTDPMAELEKT